MIQEKRNMMILMKAEGCTDGTITEYGKCFELLVKKLGLFWKCNRIELLEYLGSITNWNTRNMHRSVILKVCNGLYNMNLQLPYVKKAIQVMPVYTVNELKQILAQLHFPKHVAIAYLLINEGFRPGEIIKIKISDCNSKERTIINRSTKSKHDVVKIISEATMNKIIDYYKSCLKKPKLYLFEGQGSELYSIGSIQQFMRDAIMRAGLYKGESCRIMRRSNGTFKMENGWSMKAIADSLGNTVRTVEKYYSVMRKGYINRLPVPIQ